MVIKHIRRGEIYCANLNPVVGSEQGGNFRPVLVVQNNMGNKHSPTVVVVPITCNLKKNPLPTHVKIPLSCGLTVDSLALIEQIRTIDRLRLDRYIGCIDCEVQSEVDTALATCVGIEKYRATKGELLTLCLCNNCENDFNNNGYILIKKGWQDIKPLCDFCKSRSGFVFGIISDDLLSG